MASSREESRKRSERSVVPSPTPFYPMAPGYQLFMSPWGPLPIPGNIHYPWSNPPWINPSYSNSGGYRPWCPFEDFTPHQYRNESPMSHEDYMVDSLRHIYSNDGSIEIERVKVQKSPHDTVCYTTSSRPISRVAPVNDSDPIYSSINVTHDGKVPPPRKRRKKKQILHSLPLSPNNAGDRPPQWIPYPTYMPYTYPYQFPLGFMPPPMPQYPYPYPHSHYHHPFTTSPDQIRSPSPSDGSENPSSKGDYDKAEKIENKDLPSSSPNGEGRDDSVKDENVSEKSKTSENDETFNIKVTSTPNGTLKSSLKNSKTKQMDERTRSLNPIDLTPEKKSQDKETNELVAAFKYLEETADKFKHHASQVTEEAALLSSQEKRDQKDNIADASSCLSIETVDSELIENEFTDTTLKEENSIHDESDTSSSTLEESDSSYLWILKTDEDSIRGEISIDERTQPWRAEVSLWRARLIVSLCKGQSLDQHDWETFHLMVQHPLSINMKLSLLNAQQFCCSNTGVGVASLRNALLYFIPYGEMLLKGENQRAEKWNVVYMPDSHFWRSVKGSQEMMRVFGYLTIGDEYLKYHESYSPEPSVIARMTLDMLVLAEEFRIYLAGNHNFPNNITLLFTQNYQSTIVASAKPVEVTRKESVESSGSPLTDSSTSDSTSLPTVIKKIIETKENSIIKKEEKVIQQKTFNDESTARFESSEASKDTSSSSPASSIPDLQSICTTLPSLVVENDDNKEVIKENPPLSDCQSDSLKPSAAEEFPKRRSKVVSKDNPDEHIYEEICELKTQEKKSEGFKDLYVIPPIPPKSKRNLMRNDPKYQSLSSSLCSAGECSVPSTTRKKKRRAPMPPDYSILQTHSQIKINKDEIQTKEIQTENTEPLTNTDVNKENTNPFYEKQAPRGFIGKNPFYEDLELKTTQSPPPYSSIKKETNNENPPKIESENKPPEIPIKQGADKQEFSEAKNVEGEPQFDSRVVAPNNPSSNESLNLKSTLSVKTSVKGVVHPPSPTKVTRQKPPLPPHSSKPQKKSPIINRLPNKQEPVGSSQKNQTAYPIALPPKTKCITNSKKVEASVINIQTAKSESTENSPIIPPMPPPKAPLKLLEDIPYIDTNELIEIRKNLEEQRKEDPDEPPERTPPPPPNVSGKSSPETPGTSPPASPVIFLRGSSGTTVIIEDIEKKDVILPHSQASREDSSREKRTISIFEERYEIPDLTRVEANIKLLESRNLSTPTNLSVNVKSKEHEEKHRAGPKDRPALPPPRPPKKNNPEIPSLPPKLTDFSNSLWHSGSFLERSVSPSKKSSTSSPSLTSERSNTFPIHQKTITPHAAADRLHSDSSNVTRSVSMPSSPRAMNRSHPSSKANKGKSWSSVFCDCVYANESIGKR